MLKLRFIDDIQRSDIPLEGNRISVGRNTENDIVINDDFVSGYHSAFFLRDDGQYELADNGPKNPTKINGSAIVGRHIVKIWDVIEFGSAKVEIVDPQKRRPTQIMDAVKPANATRTMNAVDSAASAQESKWSILGENGNYAQKTIRVSHGMMVGRGDSCTLRFPETVSEVSGNHAVFEIRGEGLWVIDRTSTNGTWVNGKRFGGKEATRGYEVALNPGDSIEFGGQKFSISKEGGPKTTIVTPYEAPISKAPKRGLPKWAFGVIGFAVVLVIGVGGIVAKNAFVEPEFPLQANALWQFPMEGAQPGRQMAPTTPVLTDVNGDDAVDVAFATSSDKAFALDGRKGEWIFRSDAIKNHVVAPAAYGHFDTKNGSEVVIASTGIVTVLDGGGLELWRSSEELNLGAIEGIPVVRDINGDGIDDVIVATERRGLVALDGQRGRELWNTERIARSVVGSPVVADLKNDGTLDLISISQEGMVSAISISNGQPFILWKPHPITDANAKFVTSPLLTGNDENSLVVFMSLQSGAFALDPLTGRQIWHAKISGTVYASPIGDDVNGDGVVDVIIITTQGTMIVLDGRTGDEIWSAGIGGAIRATPALFDFSGDGQRDVIVGDEKGRVWFFDMVARKSVNDFKPDNFQSILYSPVLGDINGDKRLDIVVVDLNGWVSALTINRTVGKYEIVWGKALGNDTHSVR